MRHKEAVSLEGNTPSLHQNKTHRSASMPRCTAAIHRFSKQLGVESLSSVQPKSATGGKLVRRAISASSPCPSRSVGDLCRRGTPSPLTPPKTTLLTRVLARRRRIIHARKHTKIRIRKFILKALQPFIQKFAPSKISRYTVLSMSIKQGSHMMIT